MELSALETAYQSSMRYLRGVADRPVGSSAGASALRAKLGGPMPEQGEEPARVIAALARDADPGIVATAGPRYFGFVVGGSLPAALGADWLASPWDQNAGLFVLSPAAAAVEEIALGWLIELLGLPAGTGVGFVTGGQMANTTCLTAARHAVLGRAGWNVAEEGLQGAPRITVLAGDEAHVTIYGALRLLGLGDKSVRRVASDGQGRMRPDALARALAELRGPTIVCAQAGNVNTGAFDPLEEIAPLSRAHGAWLHVDGAFGLWAAASPGLRGLVAGVASADSWATDAHKWLNVPYDSGLAFVRDTQVHRAALARNAAYLQRSEDGRDNYEWVSEFSRRARGFAVYAALRSLGRKGVVDLVDRSCAHARRFAALLSAVPGVRVLNDVVLNQVLVRFQSPASAGESAERDDAWTREVIARVQREGTCWLSGTVWHGATAMRISISNWSTTGEDIERSYRAIVAAHAAG